MLKVLLIDDEPRLVRAWERLFASEPGIELVGTRDRADGLLSTVTELKPDVVVIDLTMPGVDPLDAIRQIVDAEPATHCVVYSAHGAPDILRAAHDAGARGYIDKVRAPMEMFPTIRRVAAGEVVFPEKCGW